MKEAFAFLAIGINIFSSAIYVISVLKKQIKPHLFTWIIWFVTTVIVAGIQYAEGAGAGAWATGFAALACFTITVLSFRYGQKNITRGDWVFLFMALMALPMWLGANSPTVAACWLTFIDQMGYLPTFRKTWSDPWSENLGVFLVWIVCSGLSVAAIESHSVASTLYPSFMTMANIAIAIIIFFRRRRIAKG